MHNIFVTGATGYIGSHTCVELLMNGFNVLGLDNFQNSSPVVLERIRKITGRSIEFVEGDIRDESLLDRMLERYRPVACVHFAGLKAVGESVQQPLKYYTTNIAGSLSVLNSIEKVGIKNFIFSSSATVYGAQTHVPIHEAASLQATNPYGESKLATEKILRDVHSRGDNWGIAILRYFNPVGAHRSGLIGEDPRGTPNNLMPFISQVAVGKRTTLSVFGNDYPTRDGTGIRDYIHVVDLAKGHVAAVNTLIAKPRLITVNLGTGRGYSVLELIAAFENASGRKIPYQITQRRPGDIAQCFADCSLAAEELGWHAIESLQTMCEDTWRWQAANPDGYTSVVTEVS